MFGDLLSLFLALFVFSAFNVLWISLLIHILLFFYAPTKRTAKIILHILLLTPNILAIIFWASNEGLKDIFDLWMVILGILISDSPTYRSVDSKMEDWSIICPYCGEWNRAEFVKELDRDGYKKRVDVKRDIRNKEGEKIGSYDASEIRDFTTYTNLYRCKACGESFINKETMQR